MICSCDKLMGCDHEQSCVVLCVDSFIYWVDALVDKLMHSLCCCFVCCFVFIACETATDAFQSSFDVIKLFVDVFGLDTPVVGLWIVGPAGPTDRRFFNLNTFSKTDR